MLADADAMADMHAAADMHAPTETRAAADVAHSATDVAAAVEAAAAAEAAGISRIGRCDEGADTERGDSGQRQHGGTDPVEHVSLLGVLGQCCFGHWSLGPVESVHGSVRFLPFNSRNLAFITRSSGRFRRARRDIGRCCRETTARDERRTPATG
jgi:hypothetical protein